jgi:hypothetical protein
MLVSYLTAHQKDNETYLFPLSLSIINTEFFYQNLLLADQGPVMFLQYSILLLVGFHLSFLADFPNLIARLTM